MNEGQIKVGMIRCDLHGVYYASFMEEHDPMILREINNAAFFYHYTKYNNPRERTVPVVSGFKIVKVWDEDRKRAEDMSAIFGFRPKVCKNFDEVSDDVDLVFISDCNGDGSDHLKLAAPGIEKGIPTFVDKPFAYNLQDAKRMVDIAEEHSIPIMSLSILQEIPQCIQFKNRFEELEGPEFAIIKGGGTSFAGQIHAICLAQMFFGYGVESVECMGQNPLAFIHLNYNKSGKPWKGVVLNTDIGNTNHCAFYASAYSKLGAIHSPGIGDFEFPFGAARILEKIKKMVYMGKCQVSYDDMIENIAVAEAARLAQKTGRTVFLKEIM